MQQTDLSKYNNANFKVGRSTLVVFMWYLVGRVFIHTYLPIPMFIKRGILRCFGAKIGVGLIIKPKVNIKYPWRLKIGNHCWIGEQVWIDNLDQVTFGNNVCISQGAMLLTGNHNYKKITFDLITKPIVLEDGVWIGAKAVICPGVICGSHSILSVGGIARVDLVPFTVYNTTNSIKSSPRILTV